MEHQASEIEQPSSPQTVSASGHEDVPLGKLQELPAPDIKNLKINFSGGWGLLLGIGIGLTGGVLATHLFRKPTPATIQPVATQSPQPVQTVTLATVEMASIPRTFTATGTVEADDLLPILPEITDLTIRQVLVDEGDWVEKGQVVALLDDSVLQTQLSQSHAEIAASAAVVQERQAAVAQAQSALKAALAGQAEAEAGVQGATAAIAQAQAELAQAQRDLERSESLAQAGAISTQEVDWSRTKVKNATETLRVAQANLNSAQARISSARANISNSQAGISSSQANVNTALAQLQSSQARLAQLQTRLAQTEVRAPSEGKIAERMARVGDLASGNQPLFKLINQGSLELKVKIPETQLLQVRVGAPVTLTSDADTRLKLTGEIRSIAPVVDATSRQATINIGLPDSALLRPGMFLSAQITSQTVQGLVIPGEAVLPQADGSMKVYQIDEENTVIARTVEVGSPVAGSGKKIEIKSGLELGDRIIVLGAGFIKEGDIVRIAQSSALNPTLN